MCFLAGRMDCVFQCGCRCCQNVCTICFNFTLLIFVCVCVAVACVFVCWLPQPQRRECICSRGERTQVAQAAEWTESPHNMAQWLTHTHTRARKQSKDETSSPFFLHLFSGFSHTILYCNVCVACMIVVAVVLLVGSPFTCFSRKYLKCFYL